MKAGKVEKVSTTQIQLTGKVMQKKFAEGSKSEHNAIYLKTNHGSFQLRRLGGNPFADPVLKKLVGKKITAAGTLNQKLFIASALTPVD
jgi:hypothetical protein